MRCSTDCHSSSPRKRGSRAVWHLASGSWTPAFALGHAHISAGYPFSPQPLPLSARLRGEREGPRRASDGEGEVGSAAVRSRGLPHLSPTLSASGGGEGESAAGLPSSELCPCPSAFRGAREHVVD